jgi:hypothetical protein
VQRRVYGIANVSSSESRQVTIQLSLQYQLGDINHLQPVPYRTIKPVLFHAATAQSIHHFHHGAFHQLSGQSSDIPCRGKDDMFLTLGCEGCSVRHVTELLKASTVQHMETLLLVEGTGAARPLPGVCPTTVIHTIQDD